MWFGLVTRCTKEIKLTSGSHSAIDWRKKGTNKQIEFLAVVRCYCKVLYRRVRRTCPKLIAARNTNISTKWSQSKRKLFYHGKWKLETNLSLRSIFLVDEITNTCTYNEPRVKSFNALQPNNTKSFNFVIEVCASVRQWLSSSLTFQLK